MLSTAIPTLVRDWTIAGHPAARIARRLQLPVGTVVPIARGRTYRSATLDEITRAAAAAYRPHPSKGEQNGRAVLTKAQVRAIRRAAAAGESTRALAADFGVSQTTVWSVVNGDSWRHV